jgi:hypothetical protein
MLRATNTEAHATVVLYLISARFPSDSLIEFTLVQARAIHTLCLYTSQRFCCNRGNQPIEYRYLLDFTLTGLNRWKKHRHKSVGYLGLYEVEFIVRNWMHGFLSDSMGQACNSRFVLLCSLRSQSGKPSVPRKQVSR